MRDRKTKIVATLGPKTLSVTEDLIRAGVAVARINCSHGDPAYYEKVVSTVRAAVDSINDVCAIAFDTKGPEIRTGINKDDAELELAPGDEIVLTTNASARESGSAERVFVDWARLAERVKPKQRVVLDDGVIALDVVSVARSQGEVRCKVVAGGILGSRKGVHLPGVPVDLPAVSDKDLEDIACAKRLGADFIFASFIREAGQVEAIRALAGPNIQIISKIENKQGVDNFDAILSASDGIMVARGDLGIEVPLERVFLIQKQLIAKCNRAGKPAICATQMLESMTYAPLPTRAECVDVGNACMDGADAVMLSGETAKGKFPVKTVATMAQLCKVAEASEDSRAATLDIHGAIRNHHAFSPEEALAAAAVHASVDHDAKAILAITTQGTTARQISKFRPRCPIVCLTFSAKTARALQLCKGVHVSSSCRESGATRDLSAPLTAPMRPARLGRDPLKLPLPPLVGSPLVVPSSFNTEQLLAEGERAIEAMGLARPGEKYLAVHSVSGEPRHGDPKTLLFASIRAKDEEDADRA
ncbi:PyK [Symbiodinium sp. KB8]|nr:PyK [Symbiodinium sp. KB8]